MSRFLKSREAILLAVLVVLFAAFSVRVPGFLDAYNLLERTRYSSVSGLIAIPMTFIIATGGIDLSVASILALCGIVMGLLYRAARWPMPIAGAASVLTGLAGGVINGGIVGYVGVPPLVVTLATMALYRGIAMGLSQAQAVSDFPDWFLWLGQGSVCRIPFTSGNPAYLPAPLVLLLVAYALGWTLLRKSWVGRYTELLGENETAARFAAIDVRRMKVALYTCCGLVCGIAAIVHTAIYATAKADTASGMELEAIACVVLGGTRISGGHASVAGTLLGLAIFGVLRYGLEMAGVSSQSILILVGLVLVITTVLNERLGQATVRSRGAARTVGVKGDRS
jgi:rhamnose transport system permease protein